MQVSRQTINAIETERYTPSLPLALALARYFGTTWRRCSMTALHKTKWFLPLFSVALGRAVPAAALWAGGERRAGIAVARDHGGARALIFLLGGRSDLIRGLRGDGRDEYWQRIDVHATALAGNVVIVAIHRHVRLGVGARRERQPVCAARRDRRRRLRRCARLPQVEELSSVSTVGSSARRGGRTSRHVHCSGSLSSRKRISFVPWRKRLPCTLS